MTDDVDGALIDVKLLGAEQNNVVDDAEVDPDVPAESFDIVSYGADFDVDGLVKRTRRGDIFVPEFQREYVWSIREASRFVESLLLGLPVPGIFLAKEDSSNKMLVVDGQQRLKTLLFFYDGVFNPKHGDGTQRVFKLTKVQPQFDGKTYSTLDEKDRIKLDDSIIHATVIKQDSPPDDDTSLYYIFERLNAEGRRLYPQEIRVAIYHGALLDLLKELNQHALWRKVYGPPSRRLKDQELILRFLALWQARATYKRPMSEFLSRFAKRHKNAAPAFLDSCRRAFVDALSLLSNAVGEKVFRPQGPINAAVFDATMVAAAIRLSAGAVSRLDSVKSCYEATLADAEFAAAANRSTSDEAMVRARVDRALSFFSSAE